MTRIPFGRHEVTVTHEGEIVTAVMPDGRVVKARVQGPWVEVAG